MEVMIPYNEMDNFDFNSARSTPFTSPPTTPKPFNGEFYFSAPPSPTHLSQFYREFESLFVADADNDNDKGVISGHVDEFAFDVSQELEISSVSAEELFDGGMIKPSPVLETRRKNRVEFSPKNKNVQETEYPRKTERESRGKQRGSSNSLSNSSSRRSARSLSPRRTSQYPWEEEEQEEEDGEIKRQSSKSSTLTCSLLSSSSSKGSKKWRFKDFFLFRSASEGRASDKDPLKKYTVAGYREGKYSSIKGNETSVSSSSKSRSIVTSRAKKGKVSAHELHYTVNRALSSDLKKKTFLPYKQGILGQLAFNPAVHALANGFGLSRK